MVVTANCRFLGVKSGKTEKGEWYQVNVCDEGGESLKLFADEDVYQQGKGIPFGADVMIEMAMGQFRKGLSVRCTGIQS